MFGEMLDRKPMAEWLTGKPALFCPEAGDPAWGTIRPVHRAEIKALGEEYGRKPYPMRPATGFLEFVRSGSRKADEDPYFLRRRKLCVSALACCAHAGERAELEDVIDGIWCICEETSWVISAHNVNPVPGAPTPAAYPLPDPEKPYIDLFSAQTGMILSLIRRMLGKRLDGISPVISRRINGEIDRRILRPFMENDDFWWMGFRRKDLNNWTPWIVSNVMVCAFLRGMDRKELAALLDRACRMLDRWLDTVPADGGCDEGAGYWNMAGGALLDCLEMLEKATDGTFIFWQEEKIRNILCFPGKAAIGKGWFLNFADCDARPFLSGERIQLAGEKLGNPALTAMGKRMRGTVADQLNDVPHLTRVMSLLFHPGAGETTEKTGTREKTEQPEKPEETEKTEETEKPERPEKPSKTEKTEETEKPEQPEKPSKTEKTEETEKTEPPEADPAPEKDVWLRDLQVRLARRGGLTLGCKGGHNGENHNHNDVGSFLLYADGEPEIVDAGNMTYTAKTFSDARYSLWNTRSAYHNLPVIGGYEQIAGPEYRAREVEYLPDGMRLDMAEAYEPAAKILRCLRETKLTAEELTVTDRIETEEPEAVCWVFLFRNEPIKTGDRLETAKIRLRIPAGTKTEIEEIPITDPRMAKSFPGSLWRVRMTEPAATVHEQIWQFQKR